ncbi:hypothetical protein [Nocardia otitidiscaviarum]|uniref:hypothetical protein n=1 Tax=Nocardia otitidiscaviarum TaxID=1823 RepID=UPI0011DD07C9|nr:hypothetical protein [Nocardia otitidiscaviarum]
MSLADDLAAANHKPVRLCKTGEWLAALDQENRTLVEQAISNASRNVANLHRIASRHGCEAGETRFRKHCRRECSCYAATEAAEAA